MGLRTGWCMGRTCGRCWCTWSSGEAEAGIVYRTDAKEAGDKVKVAATANAEEHEAIEYPAALIAASTHKKTAQAFLDFLARLRDGGF